MENDQINPNKHISDFLEYYCTLKDDPHYAVLIKGEWGAGKTYFVKDILDNLNTELPVASTHSKKTRTLCNDLKNLRRKIKSIWYLMIIPSLKKLFGYTIGKQPNTAIKNIMETKPNYLYVSLYGIDSLDAISDELFKQLFPILSKSGAKIFSTFISNKIKSATTIDLNKEIKLPKYLAKITNKNYVLVFDDLERTTLNTNLVLGFINNFVEFYGFRVIIVSNEKELQKLQTNSSSSQDYNIIKEKLIGHTFEVKAYFNSFISDYRTGIYENHIDLIEELFNKSDYHNLRYLKQALLDFERLYNSLDDKFYKPEIINELLNIYLPLSFELKKGLYNSQDLLNKQSIYGEPISIQGTLDQDLKDNIIQEKHEYYAKMAPYNDNKNEDIFLYDA